MSRRTMITFLTLLLSPSVPLALAQHEHGEEHGKPAEFKMPTTYKDAVGEIKHRLHEIEELIEAKKLDQVHREAEVIQKVGNKIGELALKADSGVPRAAVKDVNKAGRELAEKFDAIDKAGDSGDAAGTRKVYDEMVKLSATLEKYAPVTGPHGGVLASASDHKHQIEVTLSNDNDIHVYAYDEHSKPHAADHVIAQAHGGKKGSPEAEHKPVSLAPDPSKSFLSGKFDLPAKPPLTVMFTIDFKDGGKAQMFTVDLDAPTAAPHKDHQEHREHPADEHKGHRG